MFSLKKSLTLILFGLLIVSTETVSAQTVKKKNSEATQQLEKSLESSRQFIQRLKIDSALYFADETIRLAEAVNQPDYAISARIIKAKCYGFREKFDLAFQQLDLAEQQIKKANAVDLWATFYNQKGKIYSIKNDFANAVYYLKLALVWQQKLTDQKGLCILLYNLSLAYSYSFELDSSQFYLLKALPIAEQINDSTKTFEILKLMIYNYGYLDEMNLAYESGLKADRMIAAMPNKIMKSTFYLDMATISVKTNHIDTAKYFAAQYDSTIKGTKDDWSIRNSDALKGSIFFAENKTDSAEFYFRQSIFDNDNNSVHFKAEHYDNKFLNYAICLIENKKNEEAVSYLKFNFGDTAKYKGSLDVVAIYYYLTIAYINLNIADSANYFLHKYQSTKDSIFKIARSEIINNLNKKYETDKQVRMINELELNNKLASLNLILRNNQLNEQMLLNTNQQSQLLVKSKENALQTAENLNQKNVLSQNNKLLILKRNEAVIKSAQLKSEQAKKNIMLGFSIIVIALGCYLYWLYQKRKKLSNQLSISLTELKQTQSQLIQLEKEKEAEAIRLRISRDIHDDIGSNLTKIALLSDLTSMQGSATNAETTENLERISNYSRDVNQSLSEIIWAVNPMHDTLKSMLGFMRIHINTFFENTSIAYQINFPTDVDDIKIDPNIKRNVFLVLKESLNNVLKYAQASNVSIQFTINENRLELQIKDDGIGFISHSDKQTVATNSGNGLYNMQARMQQIQGTFDYQTAPGKGTIIKVAVSR